ncbi:protein ANTHESIS POMOTING FACTOR 1-like isoform X2 [Miscanthus floridulus]|uniref:protein ANTHESIS POMOTING FACTOR 1-like isoform X2 n=1 Tax=Miscanthus floridulus TaxID=154761 RepID=UPI003458117B
MRVTAHRRSPRPAFSPSATARRPPPPPPYAPASRCPGLRGALRRRQKHTTTMVSMEITDEMLKSMEVGLACRNYNGRISSMDFHRKDTNYLVTASDDETIRLYDTQDAVCLNTINSKKYGAELVCFTDNPSIVLYSSNNGWDESLRLLSMNDKRFIRYYKGHVDRVVCITLCSGKENFLSASLDRKVLLWDHRAEKSQGVLRVQRRPAVSYDGQGMVFAVAFGGRIRMYDSRKFGKGPFATFSVGTDDSEPHVIKFSSDGRRILLTTKAGRVHVLDSFEGNRIATFHAKPILTNSTLEASFCPEGNHIISGSGDGSVYAWNVESGKVQKNMSCCMLAKHRYQTATGKVVTRILDVRDRNNRTVLLGAGFVQGGILYHHRHPGPCRHRQRVDANVTLN